MPLFVGTLKAALVAMLFAVPLGVGAAIYSSEFAPKRLREIIKPLIELLAGIPSVVLGFFALIVLATWLQKSFGLTYRLNALNAGIALGITVVPVIFTVAEDAMTAVPRSLREAAVALGANPWQVSFTMVLLRSGIAAGVSWVSDGLSENHDCPDNRWHNAQNIPIPFAPFGNYAEIAEVVFDSPHYNVLFFIDLFYLHFHN
jgi:phosphate transport system permease protein